MAEEGISDGASGSVFKARFLLKFETDFYIGNRGIFKGLVLSVARLASPNLAAGMIFHPSLPIRPPRFIYLAPPDSPQTGAGANLFIQLCTAFLGAVDRHTDRMAPEAGA